MLSTVAMVIRNFVLLGILAFSALQASAVSLLFILIPCALVVWKSRQKRGGEGGAAPDLGLQSPFSLKSALKFGFIFLALQVIGGRASVFFGHFGFYAVSFLGGLVSSASAVASAATLVSQGQISAATGGMGAVLASLASAAINVGLVARFSGSPKLARRLARAIAFALLLGVAGAVIQINLHL
jgi:uncharacterized membrane protein (DUF4010 family)